MAVFDRYTYEESTKTWTNIGTVNLLVSDIRSLSYQRHGFTSGISFPVCDILTTINTSLVVRGDYDEVMEALHDF